MVYLHAEKLSPPSDFPTFRSNEDLISQECVPSAHKLPPKLFLSH